jgi:hypothetical protein
VNSEPTTHYAPSDQPHQSRPQSYVCNQCLSPLTLWFRIPMRRVYSIQHGVYGANHRPAVSHWQSLSFSVVSSTPAWSGFELVTLVVIGIDYIGMTVVVTGGVVPKARSVWWVRSLRFYSYWDLHFIFDHTFMHQTRK